MSSLSDSPIRDPEGLDLGAIDFNTLRKIRSVLIAALQEAFGYEMTGCGFGFGGADFTVSMPNRKLCEVSITVSNKEEPDDEDADADDTGEDPDDTTPDCGRCGE